MSPACTRLAIIPRHQATTCNLEAVLLRRRLLGKQLAGNQYKGPGGTSEFLLECIAGRCTAISRHMING